MKPDPIFEALKCVPGLESGKLVAYLRDGIFFPGSVGDSCKADPHFFISSDVEYNENNSPVQYTVLLADEGKTWRRGHTPLENAWVDTIIHMRWRKQ